MEKRRKPRTVEEALDRLGFWYPPDAIAAVREGRTTYHPLDPKIEYPINPGQRALILKAIEQVEQPEVRPETLHLYIVK